MARKKAEIDALLSAIVTRETASDALYTRCFANQKLVQEWRRARKKEKRLEEL
jgi:hypothetical protein